MALNEAFKESLEYKAFTLAKDGNVDALKSFLENHKVDLEWVYPGEKSNRPMGTALVQACRKGHHECVRLLTEHGADINAAYGEDKPGCLEYVKDHYKFIPNGEYVLAALSLDKVSPERQSVIDMQGMIMRGESVDFKVLYSKSTCKPEEKEELLAFAVSQLHSEIIDALMADGARMQSGKFNEIQYMTMCAYNDRHPAFAECLAVLRRHGVHMNDRLHETTNTALQVAVEFYKKDIVGLLLKAGADPNISNKSWLPINQAIRHNQKAIVETLVDHGSKTSFEDIRYGLLGFSIRANSLSLFEKLVAKGLHETEMINDMHALHYLCSHNGFSHTRISDEFIMGAIDALLDHGVDVNLTTKPGWSPMMLAAKAENGFVVEHLVERGGNPDIESVRGKNVFNIMGLDREDAEVRSMFGLNKRVSRP